MSRVLFGAALVAGLAYLIVPFFVPHGAAAALVLKGLPVGLLALAAAAAARRADGWLLALVMALGAAGDVLLEIDFDAGVAAFAVGHVVAIVLYVRNRRKALSRTDGLIAAGLLLVGLLGPALTLPDGVRVMPFTFYALLLSAMADAAWASRFPRITGYGAMLFVASDALIALRMGVEDAPLLDAAIWATYFAGQAMIFTGVRRGLVDPPLQGEVAGRRPDEGVSAVEGRLVR